MRHNYARSLQDEDVCTFNGGPEQAVAIQCNIGNVDVNYRIVFRGLTILSPMSMTVTLAYVKRHQHDVTNVGYVMSTCLKTMFAIIVHGAVNVSEINFVGSEPEKLPLGLRKFRIETRF